MGYPYSLTSIRLDGVVPETESLFLSCHSVHRKGLDSGFRDISFIIHRFKLQFTIQFQPPQLLSPVTLYILRTLQSNSPSQIPITQSHPLKPPPHRLHYLSNLPLPLYKLLKQGLRIHHHVPRQFQIARLRRQLCLLRKLSHLAHWFPNSPTSLARLSTSFSTSLAALIVSLASSPSLSITAAASCMNCNPIPFASLTCSPASSAALATPLRHLATISQTTNTKRIVAARLVRKSTPM